MKEKMDFYSSLLFTALCCWLLLESTLWLAGIFHQIPAGHKQLMLAGFLMWFLLLLARRDRDDDWAGQL
jgi:hypothetical protein